MDFDTAIVDCQLGNLFSVSHACRAVGLRPLVTSDAGHIMRAKAVILPGVGAFGDAMTSISSLGLGSVLVDYAATGRPLIGICLGMQLLMDESEEFGTHKGLGLIAGVVKRLPASHAGMQLRVPNMGWSPIHAARGDWTGTPLEDNLDNDFMYFVHSYYVQPSNGPDVCAVSEFGGFSFCSALSKGNVFAAQFHPEKSGHAGLKLYRCLARLVSGDPERGVL